MELRTPVRLSWDLSSAHDLSYDDIAAAILAAKFLALDLRDEELSPACRTLLHRLHGAPLGVTLAVSCCVLRAACCESELPPFLFAPPVRLLLVEIASPEELPHVAEVVRAAQGRVPVGISFPVSRGSWEALPEVVRFCVAEDIPHLAIPMTRVVAGEECLVLTPAEQRRLGDSLAAGPQLDPRRLSVHDPFLWRLLHPGAPFPEGSCQAANTMLHIAADGTVYPCPLGPVSLGSLHEAGLGEILTSAAKREVREKLRRHPAGCQGCSALASCHGGCRGRAYALTGSWDAPDPGCGVVPGGDGP
ncbi:MAG TPA: SPASM domain-containing protein [Geobacteraceae bacterium]